MSDVASKAGPGKGTMCASQRVSFSTDTAAFVSTARAITSTAVAMYDPILISTSPDINCSTSSAEPSVSLLNNLTFSLSSRL